MSEDRINEIIGSMKSFNKEKYKREELLEELLLLQKEMVELTFNEEHASTADLKIWNVKNHFVQLNEECNNVAEEELSNFCKEQKAFSDEVRSIISGNIGESKVFKYLEGHKIKDSILLKNLELSYESYKTEIDALVITSHGISIIEVKNSHKNIFIDENGDYYRMGRFLKLDSHIKDKFELKEKALREVLGEEYKTIEINKIIVFTNNLIEVQNNYPEINTCFIPQLNYYIGRFKMQNEFEESEMESISDAIKKVAENEAYPVGFDVEKFKYDFALLMSVLEEARSVETEQLIDEETEDFDDCEQQILKEPHRVIEFLKDTFDAQTVAMVGGILIGGITALVAGRNRG